MKLFFRFGDQCHLNFRTLKCIPLEYEFLTEARANRAKSGSWGEGKKILDIAMVCGPDKCHGTSTDI